MIRMLPIAMLALLLQSCVPWTVRPIEGEKTAASPAQNADSIWSSKLIPAITHSAVDARVLLDALAASPENARAKYGPAYFMVKGEGVVTGVNTSSRAGLATIDVAPFDGRPDLSIQIGPVLRGNSLRDATGVVRFTDFLNQLQFADAGNELNDRVLKTVLAPLDKAALKGRTVSFMGTLAADTPLRELVPVKLTVEARK